MAGLERSLTEAQLHAKHLTGRLMVAEERATQLETQLGGAQAGLEELRGVKGQLEAALQAAQAQLHAQHASRRALAAHWQEHHRRRRAAAVIQRAWRRHARRRARDVAARAHRVLLDTQAAVGSLQERQSDMQAAHAAELARLGQWMVVGGAQGLAGNAQALLRAFVVPKKQLAHSMSGAGGGSLVGGSLGGGSLGGGSMLARLQRVCDDA